MKDRLRKRREAEEEKLISSSNTAISNFSKFENYFASHAHANSMQASPKKTSATNNNQNTSIRYSLSSSATSASMMNSIRVKRAKIANDVNTCTKNENIMVLPARENKKCSYNKSSLSSFYSKNYH